MLTDEMRGLIELQCRAIGLSDEQTKEAVEWADGVMVGHGILENLSLGHLRIAGFNGEEPTFSMTDAGRDHVQGMLREHGIDPESVKP
jgi:hypothetical protein